MTMALLKTGPWNLSELKDVPSNGLKVFSAFHGGGGSTMGYRLAGYEVLGGVEIDPEMMAVYKANHNPKYSYLMGVQDFNKIPNHELPKELFDLDILDGSPPCSSFSMAGSREKAWSEKKKFREGQTYQVLDDLFFHFIDMAKKLQPKVVVAENVKGLVMEKAKGYVKKISQFFDLAGYDTQLFLLNSAFMGVPQRRERTFFFAKKKSLQFATLALSFNEKNISLRTAFENTTSAGARQLRPSLDQLFDKVPPGKSFSYAHSKGFYFTRVKVDPDRPSPTATADAAPIHWSERRHLSPSETVRVQTFPEDFNFLKHRADYICGMSVPPFMMQRVASEIERQWFNV
jgi:DNA (cytosine-5)-methyltransferase 1